MYLVYVQEVLARQSFYLRLRVRPVNKGEQGTYEHVHVVGHYRYTSMSMSWVTTGRRACPCCGSLQVYEHVHVVGHCRSMTRSWVTTGTSIRAFSLSRVTSCMQACPWRGSLQVCEHVHVVVTTSN